MTGAMSQPLRTDARETRERVVDAARELFGRSGLDVTMREVAVRAGVATATLYRRFPTKRSLAQEAFEREVVACREIVTTAAADPDPWRGFTAMLERVLVRNAANQALIRSFVAAYPGAFDVGPHRAELRGVVGHLADRAIAAGRLRADFRVDDFVLLLLAGRGIAAAPADQRVPAARRFARLAIDGFRQEGRQAVSGSAS